MNPTQSKVYYESAPTRFNRMTCAFFLALIAFLHPTLLRAAVTFVAPEWKAHFRTNLVIDDCIFERTAFLQDGITNLYHVRYQENAFLVREIRRIEDAVLDHIAGMNSYAGHFESNYWAVEGGRVLKVFPNADGMIREFRNPEVSLIEAPRTVLVGALFYGFYLLDPGSVQWLDETTFTASGFRGGKVRGIIREAPRGLPTVIELHAEAGAEPQFRTECKYLKEFSDFPYYPSEILVQMKLKGEMAPTVAYRMLSLKRSRVPLLATLFDSKSYFWAPTSSVPQTLMVTNDRYYIKNATGGWEKVLPGPPHGFGSKLRKMLLSRFI
jgi:hypothetical protein